MLCCQAVMAPPGPVGGEASKMSPFCGRPGVWKAGVFPHWGLPTAWKNGQVELWVVWGCLVVMSKRRHMKGHGR